MTLGVNYKLLNSVEQGRKIIAESEKLTQYKPKLTPQWDKAYEKYVKIIQEEI